MGRSRKGNQTTTCNEIGVTRRYMRSGSGALSTRGTNLNQLIRLEISLFGLNGFKS